MKPIASASKQPQPKAPQPKPGSAQGVDATTLRAAQDAWLQSAPSALGPPQAWAVLQSAKLPPLPWTRHLPGRREAWVREASGQVAQAYGAYQSLRLAASQDPIHGPSPAQLAEASSVVAKLAQALAQEDPKGHRHALLSPLLRAPMQTIRLGIELPAPQRGAQQDAQAWAQSQAAWWSQQGAELALAREAVKEASAGEALLGISTGAAGMDQLLAKAEATLQERQSEGDLLGGLKALVGLGQILGQAYAHEQAKAQRP